MDKKESKLFSWEKTINFLAEKLNTSWGEILKMNIYTFNHRIKFFLHVQQEINSNIKRKR